jgi:hypothetical protein
MEDAAALDVAQAVVELLEDEALAVGVGGGALVVVDIGVADGDATIGADGVVASETGEGDDETTTPDGGDVGLSGLFAVTLPPPEEQAAAASVIAATSSP